MRIGHLGNLGIGQVAYLRDNRLAPESQNKGGLQGRRGARLGPWKRRDGQIGYCRRKEPGPRAASHDSAVSVRITRTSSWR